MVFIDTNILVYGTTLDSPFYEVSVNKLAKLSEEGRVLCISNQIIREFLGVTTRLDIRRGKYNPTLLEEEVTEFEKRFYVVEENRETRKRLLSLLKYAVAGGKQVHHANIAATMLHYGISKLLTHNVVDFKRFGNLIEIIPLLEE